jgi:hypothetical protein
VKFREQSIDYWQENPKNLGYFLKIFDFDQADQKTRKALEELIKEAIKSGEKEKGWEKTGYCEGYVIGYFIGYNKGLAFSWTKNWDELWAKSHRKSSPKWTIKSALEEFSKDKAKYDYLLFVSEDEIKRRLKDIKATYVHKKKLKAQGRL